MGGTYGYELDLTKLPQEELDAIRRLNAEVKALQPLLLYGEHHRLRSPFSGNDAAWMSVSEDRREAIVTHVFAQSYPNQKKTLLRLRGLNPNLLYRDEKIGNLYGGDELMYHGIPLCTPWNDYMAQQFHLIAVD